MQKTQKQAIQIENRVNAITHENVLKHLLLQYKNKD